MHRRNTGGRSVRSKIRWLAEICNSHYVSHFAAFFIDAGAKRSIVEGCDFLQVRVRRLTRRGGSGSARPRRGGRAEVRVWSATCGGGRPSSRGRPPAAPPGRRRPGWRLGGVGAGGPRRGGARPAGSRTTPRRDAREGGAPAPPGGVLAAPGGPHPRARARVRAPPAGSSRPPAARRGAPRRGSEVWGAVRVVSEPGLGNDPSAGSPTETLLRLFLHLNDPVWITSQPGVVVADLPGPVREPH